MSSTLKIEGALQDFPIQLNIGESTLHPPSSLISSQQIVMLLIFSSSEIMELSLTVLNTCLVGNR